MNETKLDYKHMAKVFCEKAQAFREYEKKFNGDIDFSEPHIASNPRKGCYASIGGWLSLHYRTGWSDYPTRNFYARGAVAFTEELGFKNLALLVVWMGSRPEIWGNEHGRRLFAHPDAYGLLGKEITLSVVADWWDEVAFRLEFLVDPDKAVGDE